MIPNKYVLYEASVQSPESHIDLVTSIYSEIQRTNARHLREDFCGTFQLSCEWIKRHPRNTAVGIDLDPEPLDFGKKNHLAKLSPDQKKRMTLLNSDVLIPTKIPTDMIIAGNFSFFIFKKRELVLNYFRSCLKSLSSKGILVLEMAGGPGMIATTRERKTVHLSKKTKFVYTWDQKSFDPITHDALYAIHFKFPNGKTLKDAFVYDWRLWTIPEIRELLAEAGFSKSFVYWETEHKGKGTGEYAQMENGDNSFAWIAQVVGVKN